MSVEPGWLDCPLKREDANEARTSVVPAGERIPWQLNERIEFESMLTRDRLLEDTSEDAAT